MINTFLFILILNPMQKNLRLSGPRTVLLKRSWLYATQCMYASKLDIPNPR
jgi:hypothetical protein